MILRARLAVLVALLGAACQSARPSALPRDEDWVVAVKSCRLPDWMEWYTRFAHHTWIDAKRGSEQAWVRVEVGGKRTGGTLEPIGAAEARSDRRWGRDAELHEVIVGARARRIGEQLDAAVARHGPAYQGDYDAWPGPNSNTFVRQLADDLPELRLVFDHNALGKDYCGWGALGWAPSGTGVRADTYPLGLTLALREGLELHVLQLNFGVQLWPPRLQLPFLPEIPWSQPVGESARPQPARSSAVAPVAP